MTCFLNPNRENQKFYCPFGGNVTKVIRIISSNCMIVGTNSSGDIIPWSEKKLLILPMGEYCLAANLFLEEMDHGCPRISGYNYRACQVSSTSWKPVNRAAFGTYELIGITFRPDIFFISIQELRRIEVRIGKNKDWS